jgi:pimeloyl-ACP methyl ester carboxylesterase
MIIPRHLEHQLGPMEQGHVESDDGVQLLYQTFGPRDGPAIVFGNGIGVRYPGATKQVAALRHRYRIICWDYRGIGLSVMPDPLTGDVSMPRHAQDILTILDHLELDRAIFIGWSMGVQVSLEVCRIQPERMAGLVALLGTHGKPFRNAFPGSISSATEGFFGLLNRFPAVAQGALDLAVTLPGVTFGALSNLTFMGKDADRDVFDANVRSVAGVEKRLYTRTMLALAQHEAADVLPSVACPALIIAGERDHLTPPRVARQMAAAITGATYREVAGGTHFALIEQPELINSWLQEFARRVYPEQEQTEKQM